MLVDFFRKWRRVSAIHEPSASLLSKAEFKRELARERIRSTRRAFPFCVLRIRLADRTNGRVARRYCRIITSLLNRNVRLTDHKAHLEPGTFAILFTDTPEMGGRSAMARIEELLKARDVPATLALEVFDSEGFGNDSDDDSQGDDQSGLLSAPRRNSRSGDSNVSRGAVHHENNGHPASNGRQRSGDHRGSMRMTATDTATLERPEIRTAVVSADTDPSWQRFDTRIEFGREIPTHPASWFSRTVKRSVDIVGASVGLVFGSPVIVGAMIAVRMTDGKASVFKQTREGRHGKPFTIYKLRTMVVDAESKQDELRKLSHRDGPAFKIKHDPRVTTVGHILRKTCVDELPQLWNVLKGEMSLVGPRPLPWHESRACETWQRRRLDVRPGLTCYWQVDKDQVETFDDWMRMDLQYLKQSSLWVDLQLIVRTIAVPIFGRGSN